MAQAATASPGKSRVSRTTVPGANPSSASTEPMDCTPLASAAAWSLSTWSDGPLTASGTSMPRVRRAATTAAVSTSESTRATISRRSSAAPSSWLRTRAMRRSLSWSRNGNQRYVPGAGLPVSGSSGASAGYGGSMASPRISTRLELKPIWRSTKAGTEARVMMISAAAWMAGIAASRSRIQISAGTKPIDFAASCADRAICSRQPRTTAPTRTPATTAKASGASTMTSARSEATMPPIAAPTSAANARRNRPAPPRSTEVIPHSTMPPTRAPASVISIG